MGSMFKNPDNYYAGYLIETAGLKGFQVGNAQISEQHANFFVSDGDTTAEDIRSLIAEAWNSVREQCPVATTERYGRAFMPVTMDAVSAIAKDTEHFSSEWVSVAQPDAVRRPAPPSDR